MCEDDVRPAAARALTRRRVLQGAVLLAALAGCTPATGRPRATATPLPPRAPSSDRLSAYVLGMHLHASASEGQGSMHSQLREAAANGFDVAWFTEHDWRRRRLLFRPSYSFVPGEESVGGVWSLDRLPDDGSPLSGSGGAQVGDPTTPADPSPRKASLRLRVTGAGSDPARVRYRVHAEGTSRANFRSRIAGRTLSVDLLPVVSGPGAWAEVLFTLSHHPGAGSRPTGVVSVLYRLRTDVSAPARSSAGSLGVVDVPVTGGRWQTVAFDLLADLSALWPDLDARDNALYDIEFRASSTGRAPADVCFGYLRLEEQTGYDAVGVEHDLVARYADAVPDVLGLVGTEISFGPHLNQFGGTQAPYDYGAVRKLSDQPGAEIIPSVVAFIHAQGGLASINHPFAAAAGGLDPAQVIAQGLLATGAGGADILEVGYSHGGVATFGDHLAVWDALSRNGLFVTGNGVSDDHSGQGWAQEPNRFYTATWAARLDQPTLMDSLARGRTYVGYLGAFGGTIDMRMDDAVPMGAVSVGRRSGRTLRLDVTGLPDGGAVEVLRGLVDRAGPADPNPNTGVVARLGAADLQRSTELAIDTGDDCFHRVQVRNAAGDIVAFGQPIWTLGAAPPGGIPALRSAAG